MCWTQDGLSKILMRRNLILSTADQPKKPGTWPHVLSGSQGLQDLQVAKYFNSSFQSHSGEEHLTILHLIVLWAVWGPISEEGCAKIVEGPEQVYENDPTDVWVNM